MKFIRDLFSDSPILLSGVILFCLVPAGLRVLSVFFPNQDNTPVVYLYLLSGLLLLSAILIFIGAIAAVVKRSDGSGLNEKIKYFFIGYWHAIKIPFIVTIAFFLFIGLIALIIY